MTVVSRKAFQHARERLGPQLIGQQVEIEGQGVSSLCVAQNFSVLLYVDAIECGLDAIKKPAVMFGVFLEVEHGGHFRHDVGRVRKKSCRENRLRYGAA